MRLNRVQERYFVIEIVDNITKKIYTLSIYDTNEYELLDVIDNLFLDNSKRIKTDSKVQIRCRSEQTV